MSAEAFLTDAAGQPATFEVSGATIGLDVPLFMAIGILSYFGLIGLGGHSRDKAIQGVQDTGKKIRGT